MNDIFDICILQSRVGVGLVSYISYQTTFIIVNHAEIAFFYIVSTSIHIESELVKHWVQIWTNEWNGQIFQQNPGSSSVTDTEDEVLFISQCSWNFLNSSNK